MCRIELAPDLSSCIETVAKREHEEVVKKLLAVAEPDPALVEKAETLRAFLESADLKGLRAESEKHLVEGRKVRFIVSRKDGVVKYEMQVL